MLNWKYQGPQGMFFLADDKGYFKAEGLEVTLDQGNGSGAGVPLVANGTYDAAFGDINALIELAAKKPDDAPIAVYVMFNQPPFTVAVKADSPIKIAEGFRGQDARRRRQRRRAQAVSRRSASSPRSTAPRSTSPTCSRTCASRC